MKSIDQQLYKLQMLQLEHDERYHKDISNLNLHHRLNHLTLHFVKYVGRFWEYETPSENWCGKDLKKLIIDTFIIGLSTCNTLNIYLDKTIDNDNKQLTNLSALGQILSIYTPDSKTIFIKNLSIYIGRMAKVCESLDHLEHIKYRDVMSDNVINICKLMIIFAYKHKIDLYKEVQIRLREVEDNSIF